MVRPQARSPGDLRDSLKENRSVEPDSNVRESFREEWYAHHGLSRGIRTEILRGTSCSLAEETVASTG